MNLQKVAERLIPAVVIPMVLISFSAAHADPPGCMIDPACDCVTGPCPYDPICPPAGGECHLDTDCAYYYETLPPNYRSTSSACLANLCPYGNDGIVCTSPATDSGPSTTYSRECRLPDGTDFSVTLADSTSASRFNVMCEHLRGLLTSFGDCSDDYDRLAHWVWDYVGNLSGEMIDLRRSLRRCQEGASASDTRGGKTGGSKANAQRNKDDASNSKERSPLVIDRPDGSSMVLMQTDAGLKVMEGGKKRIHRMKRMK